MKINLIIITLFFVSLFLTFIFGIPFFYELHDYILASSEPGLESCMFSPNCDTLALYEHNPIYAQLVITFYTIVGVAIFTIRLIQYKKSKNQTTHTN